MEKAQLIKRAMELQRKVNRMMRNQSADVWMRLKLTVPQLKSLFFISNEGSTSIGKLAGALGVTPANVTGIVERLVRQGLVSRTENPEDRRMLLLQTTEKGRGLIADLRERRTSWLSEILDNLSPDELSRLAEGLSLLLQAGERQQGKKPR